MEGPTKKVRREGEREDVEMIHAPFEALVMEDIIFVSLSDTQLELMTIEKVDRLNPDVELAESKYHSAMTNWKKHNILTIPI
jgi:hypothetical protein